MEETPLETMRLASVPYVNARPLTWGFVSGPFRGLCDVRHVSPALIPGLLRTGAIDAGLIPSIASQDLDGIEILPHLCIASRGRARSVLLVSRRPVGEIRSVALDENSRTSAALLKILLARRGARDVAFRERSPSLRAMLRDSDAALLIGDPALVADTSGLEVLDLGAEWSRETRLPFVFAVWAVRAGAVLPDGVRPFLESRQMGVASIPAIARDAARRLRITPEACESYLRTNIHFHLGSEEARGLDLFLRRAAEAGLTGGHRAPRFRDALDRAVRPADAFAEERA